MALKKVTMQDIADACGLSRNTVSKVYNGRGSVPEATRRLVLAKAEALGYHQRPAQPGVQGSGGGTIALLTQHKLLSHNFGAFFITSFTDRISRSGYTLKIFEVSPEEIVQLRLPSGFRPEDAAGLLVIELFDRSYLEMLCALRKPMVCVDGYAHASKSLLDCDFISMENIASEQIMVQRMIAAGAKRLGFVGDIEHCCSFSERWFSFCAAIAEAGLPVDRRLCILEKDSELYGDTDWLQAHLAAMPALPDAFACANDYLAIHLMTALKRMGLSIPGDVMVAGFDGSPEAAIVSPALTTALIPSAEIGRLAASMLYERIRSPEAPFRRTYIKTTPIWGESLR